MCSALENKYSPCALNDDDIFDLSTDPKKDRGVLRGKGCIWTISSVEDAEAVDGECAGPASEHDDDIDGDKMGGREFESERGHRFKPVHPPMTEPDTENAEDLKAFLAAEESRNVERGLSEDEPPDGEGYVEGSHGGTIESVPEVEAESALAVSEEESDDELDGYDETVGDGALHWEVGIDNRSEPLGIGNDYTT